MPAGRLLAAALLALALAACHLPAGAGEDCLQDADCDETEDLGCWRNTCQRLAPAAGPLAFEVIPRASGGLGPVAVTAAAVDDVELSVCPPEAVTGTVELPADHPVDVVAVAATPVPGLERRLTTTLPAEPAALGPRPFSLTLPPARWRLRFTSRDGATPPLAAAVDVPGCAPVPALEVRGGYIRELPVRFGPGPLGHCGGVVQAFDPASGEPLSAAVASRGDGEGCPAVLLTAWVDDLDAVVDLSLRVRPASGAGAAVASQDLPLRSHPGGGGLCPPDVEPPCDASATVDLIPPDGEAPPFLAPVTVVVEGALGLPVAPGTVARVEALGLLDGEPWVCDPAAPADPARCGWGQGLSPATFGARADGPGPSLSLPLLLPGRYGFTVVPDPSTAFAITAVAPLAVGGAEPVRVRLAEKVQAAGTVTFEGGPLRALVRAEPVGHAGRPAVTETGADGRWALALDPGPYRLEVRPRNPLAPWAGLDLPADFAGRPFDVAVKPRARVRGRVGSGGQAVGGAVVRAFRCEPDCAATGARAIPVGETVTAADGSFALLVPGT